MAHTVATAATLSTAVDQYKAQAPDSVAVGEDAAQAWEDATVAWAWEWAVAAHPPADPDCGTVADDLKICATVVADVDAEAAVAAVAAVEAAAAVADVAAMAAVVAMATVILAGAATVAAEAVDVAVAMEDVEAMEVTEAAEDADVVVEAVATGKGAELCHSSNPIHCL
ncbi:hypothetical protein Ciccas_006799 [Cichlidogyrus casuarinus]|uniref:Uncharacterized protein n=1 Tax=Cichlidogyrus casuarinus TaxID=1844966 RepID=A0ABD2Q4Q1_9PLAT